MASDSKRYRQFMELHDANKKLSKDLKQAEDRILLFETVMESVFTMLNNGFNKQL